MIITLHESRKDVMKMQEGNQETSAQGGGN
jgi:hypothetical protein